METSPSSNLRVSVPRACCTKANDNHIRKLKRKARNVPWDLGRCFDMVHGYTAYAAPGFFKLVTVAIGPDPR